MTTKAELMSQTKDQLTDDLLVYIEKLHSAELLEEQLRGELKASEELADEAQDEVERLTTETANLLSAPEALQELIEALGVAACAEKMTSFQTYCALVKAWPG